MKKLVLLFAALLVAGCGEKSSSEASVGPNLKYQIKGDAVTITDCDEKASGALIIPASIEGKLVISIGERAFQDCKSLTSITIPDSITSIERGAFSRCQGLRSITIPDGVTSIGVGAFGACTSLTSISIPDSVTSIGDAAFRNCSSLTSITIPDSVTSIGMAAFASCSSLTSIAIPEGVTSIGYATFFRCTSLTAVIFLGNAPKAAKTVFSRGATPTIIYRKPEAKGWGETFAGRPVKLISAEPSGDTAKPPPAEPPVAEPPVTESPSEEPSDTPKSLSDADVERLVKEAVERDSIEEREGLLYLSGESEPYSGWVKSMYDSGQVKGLAQFKDGKPADGPFTGWHENGQKQGEGTFKDGKPDGLSTMWHENGQKKGEVTMKDGKPDGLITMWHENGQKMVEGTYKDGELVSPKYWNSKGEEVETSEEAEN